MRREMCQPRSLTAFMLLLPAAALSCCPNGDSTMHVLSTSSLQPNCVGEFTLLEYGGRPIYQRTDHVSGPAFHWNFFPDWNAWVRIAKPVTASIPLILRYAVPVRRTDL